MGRAKSVRRRDSQDGRERQQPGWKRQRNVCLQELVDGGFWATVSAVEVQATTGTSLSISLPVVANAPAGSSIDHRVMVLVDGVEMDRRSVDSLLVKQETIRDGEALSEQLSTDVFSVTLFIIALGSVSFALYAMVLRRRMLAPETEEALADQTAVVLEDMNASKPVPELAAVHRRRSTSRFLHRPWRLLTVLGLHRCHRPVCPMVGRRNSGTLTDGSTSMPSPKTEGRSCQTSRLTAWSR